MENLEACEMMLFYILSVWKLFSNDTEKKFLYALLNIPIEAKEAFNVFLNLFSGNLLH